MTTFSGSYRGVHNAHPETGAGNQQDISSVPVSQYFGESTFGLKQMRERLSKEAYEDVLRCLEGRQNIAKQTADAIAVALKEWSVAKGVTHFCHWFQPLTGSTAEKHDAFITIQNSNHSELTIIEHFSGSQLIKGEPDASSFPNGGARSTFEARGYTAWDPCSPVFVVEDGGTRTLCIPSVFCDYHGNALDQKTPLLRSVDVLSKESVGFLKLLGDVDAKTVMATLGAEQEYFLVDRDMAHKRPDLVLCGRTLQGASTARGQRLDDHYFGSIPSRVKIFMQDLGEELYRLGVPVKTRHNEVAPSQFELAPIFEDMTVSADHNALTMETMKRLAHRHGFMCLLHEKPFAALNGSGKHCNWSLRNDKGENLLEPGKTPHQNLRFLAVLAVVIKAVHENAAALAASICSPGNEHRLGGNEAPPTIVSIFLGSMIEKIYESICKGEATTASAEEIMSLGVAHLPKFARDYTDRNRTSPFAFTGNKFEFRAVGSSSNVSVPMTILNAAVAKSMRDSSSELAEAIKSGSSRDEAVIKWVGDTVSKHKSILFSGNNYSDEWKREAQSRGLPVLDHCGDAFKVLADQKIMSFMSEMGVLGESEIELRANIHSERYVSTLAIEAEVLLQIVNDFVIPAAEDQLLSGGDVAELLDGNVAELYEVRESKLKEQFGVVLKNKAALEELLDKLEGLEEDATKAVAVIQSEIKPVVSSLRNGADAIEQMVSDRLWRLPKYRKLLFAHA